MRYSKSKEGIEMIKSYRYCQSCKTNFECLLECGSKARERNPSFCFCGKCFMKKLYQKENPEMPRIKCSQIPDKIRDEWSLRFLLKKLKGT